LLGYVYLPGRTTGASYNLDVNGVSGWVIRPKMGGPYRLAPVMADRIQGVGSWNVSANSGNMNFAGTGNPKLSSHLTKSTPDGGNFLFEDGHVEWRKFNPANARATIDLGASRSSDAYFYKLPNIATNL